MLSKSELNALLTVWKEQYGVQRTSRSGSSFMAVPNTPNERRQVLRYLVDTLKEKYNYTKDDFSTVTIERIVSGCTYSDWEEKKKLQRWQEQVEIDLTIVINESFGQITEFVENKREIVEREVEVVPVRKKDLSVSSDIEYPDDGFGSFEEVAELRNPIDRSKPKPDISKPQHEPDLDFSAILQGKTDE